MVKFFENIVPNLKIIPNENSERAIEYEIQYKIQ